MSETCPRHVPQAQHVGWVDASNLAGGAAAGCVLAGVGTLPAAGLMLPLDLGVDAHLLLSTRACLVSVGLMLFDIGVDAYVIVRRTFYQWVYGRGLYINELMASKLPLLGWASRHHRLVLRTH